MKRSKWMAGMTGAVLAAIVMATAAVPVFAAETGANASAETSEYSYLAGRQRSVSRNEIYAQAALIEDEEERKAFLNEHGIAETEWSEEAAASFSYVAGRERGASYRTSDDTEASESQSGYSYLTGQQRGASYHR